MSRLSKEALLAPRLVEGEHEVKGAGTVGIRGLSRQEILDLQKLEGGIAERERRMISLGVVDPPLTEADVKAWQSSSLAPEIEELTLAISNLSGLAQGAQKSGVPGV